jgi:hypothetical protein
MLIQSRVVVELWRKNGALDTSIGRLRQASGHLHLAYGTLDDLQRKVACLKLIEASASIGSLYEPRVTHLTGNQIYFLGMERDGAAWVLQEWRCTIV